jgi:MFS family permease
MNQEHVSLKAVLYFILAGTFLFFEMAIQVTPNVMATPLMHDLHLSATQLGFLSSVYFYSYSIMMIPVGLLYDRFSIARLLMIALCILGVGNALFASQNAWLALLAARVFMGFGSAFAFVGVLVIIKEYFPARQFALLVGVTQLMAALGAMLGETPVAALVSAMGWRYTSYLFAGIALALALLIYLLMPGTQQATQKIQWHDIRSGLKKLFSNPQTYLVALFAFLSWGPVVIYAELWGGTFLQTLFPISIAMASLGALLMWIGIAISAPILGYLSTRFSHKSLMFVSMMIAAIASMCLIYIPAIPFWTVLALSFPMGIGAGAQILSFDLVRMNNANDGFGIGTGFNNFGVVLGGALLQPLVSFLIDKYKIVSAGEAVYTLATFHQSLWLIPACFFVGALLSVTLIHYKKSH